MHNRAPPFSSLPYSPAQILETPENSQVRRQSNACPSCRDSLKSTELFPSPLLAAACVLSITVNITEQVVQGWEDVKHKPAAQCTCLAAACSDILGHGDLVERTDAH